MDSILDTDFDIDNPQKTHRGDYFVKVTRFATGGVEAVLRLVKPMAHEKFKEQWENHFPVSLAPKSEKSASEIEAERKANHARAVRKAKQTTRYLVQQMQADRLLTLTYRENQEDREQVKADFKRFLRLVRNGWKGQPGMGNWQYVAVLERQTRGAYHVHCAVRGYQPVKFIRACWYRALGADIAARGDETPGAVNVTSPRSFTGASRKRQWACDRLASYIVKYMQKTFDESTTEKNRYWRSAEIEPPRQYRHWLMATNLTDAIQEMFRHLSFAEGFDLRKHWMTDQGDSYFVRGVGEG